MRKGADLSPKMSKLEKSKPVTKSYILPVLQDEKALFDAAKSGNISAVRRLIAAHVNIDCTPYQV